MKAIFGISKKKCIDYANEISKFWEKKNQKIVHENEKNMKSVFNVSLNIKGRTRAKIDLNAKKIDPILT